MALRSPNPPTQKPKLAPWGGVAKPKRAHKSKSDLAKDPGLEAAFTIAEKNRTDSLLFRLPGEIRNQIYGYIFGNQLIKISRGGKNNSGLIVHNRSCYYRKRDGPPTYWPWLRGLTYTCRQVYTETNILPYTMNTIRFHNTRVFYEWVGLVSKDVLASITDIHFDGSFYATYRGGLSRIRALSNLRNVFVPAYDTDYAEHVLRAGAFVECARKQGGRWKVVPVPESDEDRDDRNEISLALDLEMQAAIELAEFEFERGYPGV